jgi:hypothetical protein
MFRNDKKIRMRYYKIFLEIPRGEIQMAVMGVLTCEILELEFAHLLVEDPEVTRITVFEDNRSARFIEALHSKGAESFERITDLTAFNPNPSSNLEVLVRVLELGTGSS